MRNQWKEHLWLFVYALIRVTKHNHFQQQLRISLHNLTRKSLLNTQNLNFMDRIVLFDNPTYRVSKCRHMKAYLYTPIPFLVRRLWPCVCFVYTDIISYDTSILCYPISFELRMRLSVALFNMSAFSQPVNDRNVLILKNTLKSNL